MYVACASRTTVSTASLHLSLPACSISLSRSLRSSTLSFSSSPFPPAERAERITGEPREPRCFSDRRRVSLDRDRLQNPPPRGDGPHLRGWSNSDESLSTVLGHESSGLSPPVRRILDSIRDSGTLMPDLQASPPPLLFQFLINYSRQRLKRE